MKIQPRNIDSFLADPDPRFAAILVYGADSGLVRERADQLVLRTAGSLDDPFRVSELTAATLRDDSARLADEAAAQSMTGGRRAVRIRNAGDALAALFEDLLAAQPTSGLVVVEAGDLPSRSVLRKLFESAATAAVLPCYRDDPESLGRLIRDELQRRNLRIDGDAVAYLVDNLGADRAVSRTEIDKLALYMSAEAAPGKVTLEDAMACIGDSAAVAMDDVAMAVADGDQAALERALERCLSEAASPVAVIRHVARHFMRLQLAAGAGDAGQAIRALRPPLHFQHAPAFRRQLERWSGMNVGRALDRLLDAEIACKRTGAPDDTLCRRALAEIAAYAVAKRAPVAE